jgi:RNA polymerase sigma-70 factor (ECF subfamily)
LAQPTPCQPVNFGEQFDHYYPAVYKYFRYRGADSDTANDLAAAVFERALAKINTFDPGKAAFNTWIFTIAHNLGINHWKAQTRAQALSIDPAQPGSDPHPEDLIIHQEGITALLAALGELEEREREVVVLKFTGALTNRQIAGLVNLTASNVGVILYRAIHKMKLELEGTEGQVRHE